MDDARDPLIALDDVHVTFKTLAGEVEALTGVSFDIHANETVAVVGESGSGKSVTALAIMGLLDGGGVSSGQVISGGRNLAALGEKQLRKVRGSEIAMIFQDPMTCLDPLYTVGNQVVEAVRLHTDLSKKDATARAVELLGQVGIPDPDKRIKSYPHQLSGGQRQRVMIALALACKPRLLIADEPTTALDVTVEAQILQLLRDLQKEYQMAILLVTHDMGVVAEMADRVVVFYAGQVVEQGLVNEVLRDPQHPYTTALFEGIPTPHTDRSEPLTAIPGAVPSLRELPSGCRFNPRCRLAFDKCTSGDVPLFLLDGNRQSRCWLAEGDSASRPADFAVGAEAAR
ncbi:peptide/nickel transport system ATP-binding protein/oligopeptide transport system ATP-binding protein [Antricoccus suffuscus]|uniref:Peptide/nickel transport system ATP-binding protein/oligopeptide transport system ATP-binding protein n=1 Tax=Antricoccus suffuscus TaxID=1629062 RepID=A0A2T1A252_9ACTN|nr:ABC transporter ATP-binding protein [Antricoccus suffuscus]PRZ42577.1 peptide/nickel transport system ATP-binding protein/oligopeptide transport system ATP-binding protein [Antricoccus suffuscus]